jgi:glycerol-3-phosphate dehydrogenase
MAQDAVDAAVQSGGLTPAPSTTALMPLHGAAGRYAEDPALRVYGTDAEALATIARADSVLAAPLHPALPYTGAHVVYAIRHEMARTVEDVLARRTRARALNAAAAAACEPAIAALLVREREPPTVSP